MTKILIASAAACLILSGIGGASAQTVQTPANAQEVRAGGAAGNPATPGVLDRLMADLGLKTSDKATPSPAQTADAR
jgi:hypothetical protein